MGPIASALPEEDKMPHMAERLRALLRETGPRPVLAGAALLLLLALALLALSLTASRFGPPSSQGQEAAERDAGGGQYTNSSGSRPENFPLIFGPGPSPGPTEATSDSDGRLRGVPGLSEMDIVGYLQYLPDTNFRCPGLISDRGRAKRTCTSSSSDDPAFYKVTLVEENPRTVLWVQVTASDAPDDEAARVLGYVARLSLKNASPIDAESWVGRTISSGGQYFADGAEVRLYGTEEARTLEIVASAPPAISSPETTDGRPVTTEEWNYPGVADDPRFRPPQPPPL